MNEPSPINNSDRLSVTLVFAILFLSVLIFGVTFTYDEPVDPNILPSMEVILVQKQSETTPDDADYLAQVSQDGGGNVNDQVRPTSPTSGPIPKLERGEAPIPVPNTTPTAAERTPVKVLTQATSEQTTEPVEPREDKPDRPNPTAAELLRRTQELARLEAEIGKELEAYAKRPRKKFINARTREYEFAGYMQAWVEKVERLSTLNYPAEVKRRNLDGQMVITVALTRAGLIDSIDIIKPSDYKILNEAAVRLIRLGEPYAPFPETFRDKVDLLHITRTWIFTTDYGLKGE